MPPHILCVHFAPANIKKRKRKSNNFVSIFDCLRYFEIWAKHIFPVISVSVSGWNGKPENHRKRSKARRRLRILTTSLRQRNSVQTSKLMLTAEKIILFLRNVNLGNLSCH